LQFEGDIEMTRSTPVCHWVLGATLAVSFAMTAHAQTLTRDAETGQLRPATAAEAKAMNAQTRPSQPVGLLSGKANPQPVVHADGTVEQELDSSSLMYSVARRNADGSISQYCVTGKDAAERIVKGKKSKTTLLSKAAKEHNHEVK
jgi:hypothetical protein